MSISLDSSRGPKHLAVAERLKRLIATKYNPGDLLPRYVDLAEYLGVGLRSIQDAMALLTDEGIVQPARRKGTVVMRRIELGETRLSQIALIARSTVSNVFQAGYLGEMMAGISDRIDRIEANLRILSFRHKGFVEPREIVDSGADGIILLEIADDDYIAAMARQDVPLVVVDHHSEGIALDYVVCDNAGAAAQVVDHLAGLGHRRIAYAESFPPARLTDEPKAVEQEESDAWERREGFVSAARAAGVSVWEPLDKLWVVDGAGDPVRDLVAAVSSGPDAPTAIVADDEVVANNVIARLMRSGVRVPRDVSVAAIASAAQHTAFPITCCVMDFKEMGTQAMDLLVARSTAPRPAEPSVVRIGFEFTCGASSAPSSGAAHS